jgi:cytochrome c peroxidase
MTRMTWFSVLAVTVALQACGGGGSGQTTVNDTSASSAFGFPTMLVPANNAMSGAKVQLGRFLFYDRRLSGNGTQSCSSCHQQDKAFTDGQVVAIGSTGELHPRNAQSLANVGYNTTLTWANPALTELETQMLVPLFGTKPIEMGVNDANKAEVLSRIASDTAYQSLFANAFPNQAEAITWDNIVKAISAFQRRLVSASSKYDLYLQKKTTLSESELRGLNLFFGEKAECFHCHGSVNFNDQVVHASSRDFSKPFHNTGLYNIGGTGAFPVGNRGLFEHTANAGDMGRFRAASLRNVAVTAPYMHDGSITTLEEVLAFYAAGGREITSGPYAGDGRLNPNKSDLVSRINLSVQDQADLVAFLKTLTDEQLLTNPAISNPFASTP